MSELVRWIFAALFFLAGMVSVSISVFGVFRYHYVLNRMQAAAIIDSLGLFFILLGLIFITWDIAYVPKLILILVFQWISSPLAAHMVGKMEVRTDKDLEKHMRIVPEEEES